MTSPSVSHDFLALKAGEGKEGKRQREIYRDAMLDTADAPAADLL